MAAAEQLAVPRMIGRYEVIAEIASGGMGVVYLARHAGEAGFQRLFAIKLMHPHLAEDRSFVDMLRDEARIAAHIHHPNVVPILDLGSQGGRYYVVMEFIDGCSLSALLGRNKQQRPPHLIVPIVIDALEGLHAAHTLRDVDGNELKLVHRDVSPQNVLLGVDGMARITDFGIAKAETRITTTRPGMRKGKLSYMAPEQLKEDGEHIDHRADVFAAGALLWGALTAQPLFRAASDGATVHNILNKPIVPPSTVGLRPPEALDAICLKALERAPNKRYASALEMADALREAMTMLGLRVSRGAVADWVKTSFAAELAARSIAIRTVTQRSRPPAADESLPALPALTGPTSLSSQSLPSLSGADLNVIVPVQSLTGVASSRTLNPPAVGALEPNFRPKRTLLVAAVLAAAILALSIVWIALRPSTKSAPTAAASTLSTTAQPAAPKPTLAQPEPPATSTATSVEVKVPEPVHSKQPATSSRTRTTPTTPARKPTQSSEPKPEPKATSTPAASSTGVKIEKNPYLRRD